MTQTTSQGSVTMHNQPVPTLKLLIMIFGAVLAATVATIAFFGGRTDRRWVENWDYLVCEYVSSNGHVRHGEVRNCQQVFRHRDEESVESNGRTYYYIDVSTRHEYRHPPYFVCAVASYDDGFRESSSDTSNCWSVEKYLRGKNGETFFRNSNR